MFNRRTLENATAAGKPMAKRSSIKGPKVAGPVTRRLVARDVGRLAPVLVDFSSLTITPDFILHSLFQTEFPVSEVRQGDELDALLVGRYAYSPEHFKSLTGLFIRQYLQLETVRKRQAEAIQWLEQQLTSLKTQSSSERQS
jgi:hypothetical protein